MINSNPVDIVHEELLLLLNWFHLLCKENGIQYSLHAGTLLGAIREKGFIPWDDDADLTLTRAEYNKLRQLMSKNSLPETIHFEEYIAQRPMLWMHRPGKPKVWIDIFIYDYVSESNKKKNIKILGLIFFLGFTKTKDTIEISKKGSFKGCKYAIIYFLYLIGKLFSMKFKIRALNYFSENFLNGEKEYILRSNDQYKAIRLVLPKEVMESFKEIDFENIRLMISTRYHDILLSSYGSDYMIPMRVSLQEVEAHNMYRENYHR